MRSLGFGYAVTTETLEFALIARLRQVLGNSPATEAELRTLRVEADGWATALRGQIDASERRLDAAVADPKASLTELALELRRLETLRPQLNELETLRARLDECSRELRTGWLKPRAG